MASGSYLFQHHGTYWFQIRVPHHARSRFGAHIKTCLQTRDYAVAKVLALRLAGDWLLRFSDPVSAIRVSDTTASALEPAMASAAGAHEVGAVAGEGSVVAAALQPAVAPTFDGGQSPSQAQPGGRQPLRDMDALFRYWRSINPDRPESTLREFQSLARTVHRLLKKPPAELVRTDVIDLRDKLLASGKARATVVKHLGFLGAMLQCAFDGGYVTQNVARGIRVGKAKVQREKRVAFTPEALARIFSSKVYTAGYRPKAGGGDAIAWVPMLAYVTGARLEELCQLRRQDVVHATGLGWYLCIVDGEGQRCHEPA